MHKEYLPQSTSGMLDHIIEECAEIIKAVCKIQRFGFDSTNPLEPTDKETNIEAFHREFEDLNMAVKRLKEQVPCRCRRWVDFCDEYHAHRKECINIRDRANPQCDYCDGTGLIHPDLLYTK